MIMPESVLLIDLCYYLHFAKTTLVVEVVAKNAVASHERRANGTYFAQRDTPSWFNNVKGAFGRRETFPHYISLQIAGAINTED